MNFFKENIDRILAIAAILILGLTIVRMTLGFTLEPGEKASGAAKMFQVESAPAPDREALPPKELHWSFEGVTGTFDKAAVVRGAEVYRQVCKNCHGLSYVAFRNLMDLGYSENQAKAIAAGYSFPTVDEYGDPAERPGTLTDTFPSPFANENAAKAANSGRVPPDLSLITKAREDGPNYLYSLLTGYTDPPADFEKRSDTTTYNPYFGGWEIGMPPPLYDGAVEYSDGTEASVEQMATDVTNFLMWAAEPKLEARHEMGMKVVLFTLVMTLLLFISMKTIWRRVKK